MLLLFWEKVSIFNQNSSIKVTVWQIKDLQLDSCHNLTSNQIFLFSVKKILIYM